MPAHHHPMLLCAGAALGASLALAGLPLATLSLLIPPLLLLAIATLAHPAARAARPLILGALLTACALALSPPPLATLPEPTQRFEARYTVTSAPERTQDGWRFEARDTSLGHDLLVRCPLLLCPSPPLPGDLLLADASLTPFDPPDHPVQQDRRWLAAHHHLGARARITRLYDLTPPGHRSPARWLAAQRLAIEHKLLAHLRADRAAFVLAMTLGSRGLLQPAQRAPFNLTGTSHLLAISGLHLGALAAILWRVVAGLLRLRPALVRRHGLRRLCALPVSLLMTAYVLMIGAPISARRSLLMLLGALGAHALMRRMDALDSLGLAILIATLWRPVIAHEPALWLSASATLAILLVTRGMRRAQAQDRPPGRMLEGLKALCLVSLAAWLGTLPAVLLLNQEVPLLGALLNLVFVPLVSALLFPMMLAGLALLWVTPAAGEAVLGVAAGGMELMHAVAAHVSCLPAASMSAGGITGAGALGISAGIFWGLAHGVHRRRAWIGWGVAAALMLAPPLSAQVMPGQDLIIDFIPVGQGDATLITFPDGHTLLIDAGGAHRGLDPGLARVMPHLRWRGVRRLDEALLTHADVDHMRGFFAVAALATPRRFISHAASQDAPEHLALLHELRRHGADLVALDQRGLRSERAGATVEILAPQPLHPAGRNDLSLTTLISYAGARVLLPGDLEAAGEAWLVEQDIGPVAVLKMPHHGSKTSSAEALLEHVRPALAVASAGRRNAFGHPHPDVLARLGARGIHTWRTDLDGLVTVRINPRGELTVLTARHLARPLPHASAPAL